MTHKDDDIEETKFLTPDEIAEIYESGEDLAEEEIDEKSLSQLIEPEHFDEFFANIDLEMPCETQVEEDLNETLPKSVDNRKYAVDVDNQRTEGWCTAYACIAYLGYKIRKASGLKLNLSETYLWYTYQQYNTIAAARAMAKNWQGEEKYWPFQARRALPGWEESLIATLKNVRSVPSVTAMKRQLARGEPLLISLGLDVRHWQGTIIRANVGTQTSGHAVILVGYVDDSRFAGGGYFILKNSWGSAKFDKGYQYIEIQYFLGDRFRTAAYAFDDEVVWKPGKKPANLNTPQSAELHAHVYEKFEYTPNSGRKHKAYGVTLRGKDVGEVQDVKYTFNSALPILEDRNDFGKSFGTWAQSGWTAGKASVKLKNGQTVELDLKIP